jgi:hypothetical protein
VPPVHEGPDEWWCWTILTDTPDGSAVRRARFITEARLLFQNGVKALGAKEAKKIWDSIPPKRKRGQKGKHDPEGDAEALKIYRKVLGATADKGKASDAAVASLKGRDRRNNMADSDPTVRLHLRRLIEAETGKQKRDRIRNALRPPELRGGSLLSSVKDE